ncbi:MAG TPA: HRDC domain-containing protein [Propionibacteriaceae bacterium]|nr:HRDC domain-containing protein [Propionibacteriaceae bacterium]
MSAKPPPPDPDPTEAETPGDPALAEEPVELLTEPSGGVPEVVTTEAGLTATIESLLAGAGPIAVDAERAHGFRYSQRAYLVQLRRAGSGTHLIDPIAFGQPANLGRLGQAIADVEWIIHAASQDLSCLYEIGLVPTRLFDTELAGRLLGYPRVALGTLIEEHFSVRLLKEHSAADWSSRPLPPAWLTYAALDVELLIELRNTLAAELEQAGKLAWAHQEFAALVQGVGIPAEPRQDPWRRTSGMHKIRSRRGLAYVAALWQIRDQIAAGLDRAPGKILGDAAITELASSASPDRASLRSIPLFARRQARRFELQWMAAIDAAKALPDTELPPMHIPSDGPPQPRLWAAKDPEAARRLTAIRSALSDRAGELNLPIENLLTPEYVRRLAWRPPSPATEANVDAALAELGARPWQRQLTVGLITAQLS